jgi:hypothetical protein
MIHFFCPLGGKAGWDDNELRYMLRSLEKNVDAEFDITVYSDHNVPWLRNVKFKIIDRPRDGNYENFWDTLNKIYSYSVAHRHSKMDTFIYIYDDVVLLKKSRVGDLSELFNVALQEDIIDNQKRNKTKHGRTIKKALELTNGKYNYETHMPRLYHANIVLEVFKLYNVFSCDIPPSFATLYYNHLDTAPTLLKNTRNKRVSFCFEDEDSTGSVTAVNEGEIDIFCKNKMWLHYNDKGLNFAPNGQQILKNYIMKMLPNPSKFELYV